MNVFQKRLRATRLERGFTQAELAQKSYISKHIIANVERGLTEKVGKNELTMLSYALMVTEDFLLGITDESQTLDCGLKQAIYIPVDWNWETEIGAVLKKNSRNKRVEGILHDVTHILWSYEKTELDVRVKILEQISVLINQNISNSEFKLIEDLLEVLINNYKREEN